MCKEDLGWSYFPKADWKSEFCALHNATGVMVMPVDPGLLLVTDFLRVLARATDDANSAKERLPNDDEVRKGPFVVFTEINRFLDEEPNRGETQELRT
jgi:hypothetical protein